MRSYMQIVSDNVPLAPQIGASASRVRLAAGTLVEELSRTADGWSFVDARNYCSVQPTTWQTLERHAGPKSDTTPGPGFMRNRVLGGRTLPEISSVGSATQGYVRSIALLPFGYRPGSLDPLTLYVNRRLWELTQKHDAVTYSQKVRDVGKGSIDCSGWMEFVNWAIYDEVTGSVTKELLPLSFKENFDTAAAWQMTKWKKENKGWTTGKAFKTADLLPGMIIGMNADASGADRPQGIDHIVQVAWHPTTHVPHITQSSGGQGVNFEDLDTWFKKWNKAIGTDDLYAVDPYAKGRSAIGAWLSTH